MKLTGENTLSLSRERVWEALNDPDVLRRCVPGCDTFDADGENRYKVGIAVAVGPIKARFTGRLTLSNLQPLQSYSLTFEGSGGPAGFGKGNAHVALADAGVATILTYGMEAQVGGKLAQVGGRLIDGVARKLAAEFFNRFSKVAQGELPPSDTEQATALAATNAANERSPQRPDDGRRPGAVCAPANLATGLRETRSLSATVSVLGAAVAAVAAAVAVLAAVLSFMGHQ